MTEIWPACLIDGEPATGLPLDDRGLAYGDGLFETILVHAGRAVWWPEHLQRLHGGAGRLGIIPPANALWDADLTRLLGSSPQTGQLIVKLILTRGGGARGYGLAAGQAPRRIALRLPAPRLDSRWRSEGIRVRWCETRLAMQPRLAGIKHLNRLEQVLARADWDDEDVMEGLLRDTHGEVICATAANLFAVIGGRLLTPSLQHSGVAGTCRAHLLKECQALIASISPAQLLAAEELFVCSSVRGILPVAALGDHRWPVGPLTRQLMTNLADVQPAFADHAA